MGSIAARHARTVLEHVERIVAIELLVRGAGARPAAGATADGRRRRPGAGVAEAHRADPRAWSGTSTATASPGPDLAAATRARPRRARSPTSPARRRRVTAVDSRPWPIRIVDVTDEPAFGRIPPCADPGFDHRSCDYWEDADRGSKAARLVWLEPRPGAPRRAPRGRADQPVPRRPRGDGAGRQPVRRPRARRTRSSTRSATTTTRRSTTRSRRAPPAAPDGRRRRAAQAPAARPRPRGLRQLRQGPARRRRRRRPTAQFGPLSAYPRAQRTRDLYPRCPTRRCRRSSPASPRPPRRAAPASPGARRGGLRRPRRARLRGRRGLSRSSVPRPDATSAATPGVLGVGRVRRSRSTTSASRSCAAPWPDRDVARVR